jgi:hypothetical protein
MSSPISQLRAGTGEYGCSGAVEAMSSGPKLAVAGLDDLIATKRVSGRPIDRSDIIALTEP